MTRLFFMYLRDIGLGIRERIKKIHRPKWQKDDKYFYTGLISVYTGIFTSIILSATINWRFIFGLIPTACISSLMFGYAIWLCDHPEYWKVRKC